MKLKLEFLIGILKERMQLLVKKKEGKKKKKKRAARGSKDFEGVDQFEAERGGDMG